MRRQPASTATSAAATASPIRIILRCRVVASRIQQTLRVAQRRIVFRWILIDITRIAGVGDDTGELTSATSGELSVVSGGVLQQKWLQRVVAKAHHHRLLTPVCRRYGCPPHRRGLACRRSRTRVAGALVPRELLQPRRSGRRRCLRVAGRIVRRWGEHFAPVGNVHAAPAATNNDDFISTNK